MEQDFDLFGYPADPDTGKPGRPAKRPDAKLRNKVKSLFSEGKTIEEAATTIGMSQPTFRKHFFQEIKQRHLWKSRLRAEVMVVLMEEALVKKNMSAMRLLLSKIERDDLVELENNLAAEKPSRPQAEGKKKLGIITSLEADAELDSVLDQEVRGIVRH